MKMITKAEKYLVMLFIVLFLLVSLTASTKAVYTQATKIKESSNCDNIQQRDVKSMNVVKPLVFYLHNDTRSHLIFNYSTTYIFDTNLGNRLQSNGDKQRVRLNFYLFPQLAGNLTVNGNVTVGIYINTTGVSANANLYAALYDVKYKSGSTTDETLVGEGGPVSYTVTTAIDYYDVTISNVNYTFNKTHSMRLYIEVQGGASSYFTVWYGNATYDSRVKMDCENYMNIDSMKTKNYNGNYTIFFDPDANNKTLTVEANLSDPLGGYDIYWVNVTIVDPVGNVVVDNQSMILVAGTPKSYISTYEFKWNYSTYPKGQYDVYVWAVDNNGYYYYWHFEQYNYGVYDETAHGYFVIGYKYRVDIWVYDTAGNTLPNAEVELIEQYGTVTSKNYTNGQGYTMLLAYNGTYTINVLWYGNPVVWEGTHLVINSNSTTGTTVDVNGTTSIKIYADVGLLKIHVVDTHDVSIKSALTFIDFPNGTHIEAGYSDAQGNISVGYSPGGYYHISIYWKGVVVYSGDINIHFENGTSERMIEITTEVYYLTLTVLDNNNMGMANLQVVVYGTYTQLVEEVGITNYSGSVVLRLPSGEKDIKVYFQDQIVYALDSYRFDKDSSLKVHGWIYTVNFRVYDSENNPVENASILIYRDGKVVDELRTDSNGANTTSLVKSEYDVEVFWNGIKVNETTIYVDDNSTFNIYAWIYKVNFRVYDVQDKPVENAHILIYRNGKIVGKIQTNSEGTGTTLLAKSEYQLEVFWMDTKVYNATIYVKDTSTFDISAWIYYLKITLIGNDGKKVSGMITITQNGKTIYTAYGSEVEVRLPKGEYSVSATIEKVMYMTGVKETKSQDINLTGNQNISLNFKKYPINFLGSNLFFVLLGYILLILALIVVFLLRRRSLAKGKETKMQEKELTATEVPEREEKEMDIIEESVDEIDENL